MIGEEWIIAAVGIGIAIGLIFKLPQQGPQELVNNLKGIVESKKKILFRPNGQIAGIVVDEEPFHDSRYQNMKRRRMILLGLDGKRHEEPKDFINPKTGTLEDAVVIEHAGGAALTQIKNPGGVTPILSVAQATSIKKSADDYRAIERRFEKLEKEQGPLKRRYRDLQGKSASLKDQRDEALDKVNEWGNTYQTLVNQNESLSARAAAAEAELDMLVERFEGLKESHDELQKDMLESLKKEHERSRVKTKLHTLGDKDQPPGKPKEEEPSEESPKPEKPESKKESKEEG